MKNIHIEALLVERVGYERRGLKDRVAAVDVQLRALGYKSAHLDDKVESATVEPPAERAIQKRAQKRAN